MAMSQDEFITTWNQNVGNLNLLPHICSLSEADAKVNSLYKKHINRSYEYAHWYYIVFSPLNTPYLTHYDWYQTKGLDYCRKKLGKCHTYLCTRELESDTVSKTHINALCCTNNDLLKYNGKIYGHKYYMHVQLCNDDRNRVLDYITKDFKYRRELLYLDYVISKEPRAAPELAPGVIEREPRAEK